MAHTPDSKLGAIIGKKAADALEKALGYTTLGELLGHYPRTYVDRGQTSSADEIRPGEVVTLVATLVRAKQHTYTDRRTGRAAYRLEAVVDAGGSRLSMTFFDRDRGTATWRAGKFVPGLTMMISGKPQWSDFKDSWELVNPHYNDRDFSQRSQLLPIYPASGKVSSWLIDDTIALALPLLEGMDDPLPPEVVRERGLLSYGDALRQIHAPDDWQQAGAARKRLKFDEAIGTQLVLAQRRHAQHAVHTRPRTGGGGLLAAFDERLPFTLTAGQEQVCEEIMADLAADHPMHRLLQGEVGSGKTIVALRAMLRVVDSGGQAALLAPTEVLAQQHYRSIVAMLGDLAAGGMLGGADEATRVVLLTGSASTATRRSAMLDAASGAAGIVIGTHALLEDKVQFADLGLAVVDEQHRFGVEQRASLVAKGEEPPHVLVMTATPIPRTVAMTVFGDLETSILRELPAGRAPIQSTVVPLADQPAWIDRVWARAQEEVESGHQVYVVCPRIDDTSEEPALIDLDDAPPAAGKPTVAAAVEEVTPRLASALSPLRVEALHGRLAPDQKDTVMQSFSRGEVDLLVSTTVIEVGVDVPNATMMVILDADRFGVSQLHQLRGRVGRGANAGLCLLVTQAQDGTPARERLDAVASTSDGFRLSELDLRQRREGDVLGVAQSGRSSLRLLSVIHDEDVIADARDAAAALIADDPTLERSPGLARVVAELIDSARADYLDKT